METGRGGSDALGTASCLQPSLPHLRGDPGPGEGRRGLPWRNREPALALPARLQQVIGTFVSLCGLRGSFVGLRSILAPSLRCPLEGDYSFLIS